MQLYLHRFTSQHLQNPLPCTPLPVDAVRFPLFIHSCIHPGIAVGNIGFNSFLQAPQCQCKRRHHPLVSTHWSPHPGLTLGMTRSVLENCSFCCIDWITVSPPTRNPQSQFPLPKSTILCSTSLTLFPSTSGRHHDQTHLLIFTSYSTSSLDPFGRSTVSLNVAEPLATCFPSDRSHLDLQGFSCRSPAPRHILRLGQGAGTS